MLHAINHKKKQTQQFHHDHNFRIPQKPLEAYHFPSAPLQYQFPWEHPNYVEIHREGKVRAEIDHDEKEYEAES